MDNEPQGSRRVLNNDIVTVSTKVLFCRKVLDSVTDFWVALEVPLKQNRLVKAKCLRNNPDGVRVGRDLSGLSYRGLRRIIGDVNS